MRPTSSIENVTVRPIDDFGLGKEISLQAVGCLGDALMQAVAVKPDTRDKSTRPAVWQAWDGWKALLSQAAGQNLDEPSTTLDDLCTAYDVEVSNDFHAMPAAILFALHTYHAILVKLITCHALGSVFEPFEISQAIDDQELLAMMRHLESSKMVSALRPRMLTGQERPSNNSADWDPFAWYLDAWSPAMATWLRRATVVIASYDRSRLLPQSKSPGVDLDPFGELYQGLLPKKVRHALGEYYTPAWLVDYILKRLEYHGDSGKRLLDPSCGSGNFLLAAIRRARDAKKTGMSPKELVTEITGNIVGFDLNPIAVLTARANYLLAIGDLLDNSSVMGAADQASLNVEPRLPDIPVYLCDSILESDHSMEKFNYVVGNPPWIVWDNLTTDYRQATEPIWRRMGLFSLSGNDARHGGGKKDLSMLMTYVCADRYLVDRGRLGFVITQTLFQTRGAGDGFRRFRIGRSGPPLRVLHVDDMVHARPFDGASNWTGTILLEKGAETVYPVSYDRWRRNARNFVVGANDDWQQLSRQRFTARPIDRNRPTSPWFVQPAELREDLTLLVGHSDYTAHLGANTGGANPVYWLRILERIGDDIRVANLTESGRRNRRFNAVETVIEVDLVYPLVRWGDAARFRAVPSAHILLAQDVRSRRGYDEEELRQKCPKTFEHLEQHKSLLVARAAYRRYQSHAPFYSMYNVGDYTLSPHKVVWRRMDKRINAAVLEPFDDPVLGMRPIVPQETCVIIATESADEAHYLAAMMNGRQTGLIVAGHSVLGGKGFGSPGILDYLGIRRFDREDALHSQLARLSRQAHKQAAAGSNIADVQAEIDRLVRVALTCGVRDAVFSKLK